MKNKKNVKRIVLIVIIAVVVLLLGFALYLNTPYRPGASALAAKAACAEAGIAVTQERDYIALIPEDFDGKYGFIFYPGARVANESYMPLMKALAEKGVMCILLRMPKNMAFLGAGDADKAKELYPEVEEWYVGGHSLGGAMAAEHLAKCEEEYAGLVLLGAYSIKDLRASGLKVLVMYGTNDGVLNRSNYEKYRKNLPEDYQEVIIVGGNHASFGDYGKQSRDGTLEDITKEEQVEFTVSYIYQMMVE